MSNSSLISSTNLSPNHSGPRTHRIDRITPHCVVGQLSAEAVANMFKPTSRQASSNYIIGTKGDVCLCVDEANRSWCSSSNANDQRAITIECASDTTAPYTMNSTVYNKLIDLCVDICQRNGIKKLLWFGDKDKSLAYNPQSDEAVITVHRWFANKSCPGDWLFERLGDLANKVTSRLNPTTVSNATGLYRVQAGAFRDKANAEALEKKLKALKYDTCIVVSDNTYKVQTGAFKDRVNADNLATKMRKDGFDCFIVNSGAASQNPTPKPAISVGTMVRVNKGAKSYTGSSLASFIFDKTYRVDELKGDRAVLDLKGICTPVNIKDLTIA